MLNSLRELSSRSNSSTAAADGVDAAAVLDPILQAEESVEYVLTSGKGIEYTTDERTTTVEPGSGHDAYAIVTDHRVLFLVGSDAEEPSIDIEFDLETVTMAQARDSLLSSSLVVVSENTDTVKFVPSGSPDLEAIADYIDRIGSTWNELYQSLALTREAIAEFEERLASGEDAREALTQARSRLSNAHHCATRNDDGPVEAMMGLVEPLKAELDTLQVEARLDRVDDLLEEATGAREEGAFADAVDSLTEATDRLAEARDAVDDEVLEGEEATAVVDERATVMADIAEDLLDDALSACRRGQAADEPAEAARAWDEALERYRVLAGAELDGIPGVTEDALRFQLSWVVGRRIDALADRAAALEAAGDDLGEDHDDAADKYEAAEASIETARALARDHPHADAERFADRLERLSEKVERSEWEWGAAGE